MVKILTGTEALVIKGALESALDVLEDCGYDDAAQDVKEAIVILKGLVSKNIEDVIS